MNDSNVRFDSNLLMTSISKIFTLLISFVLGFIFVLVADNLNGNYSSFSPSISRKDFDKDTKARTKIFVSLSSTLDLEYLTLVPLVVLAWKQLGVEALLCLVGKDHEAPDNVNIVLDFLVNLNVNMNFMTNHNLPSATMSQMCRLFAATSDSLNLDDHSVVITSDIDYIPFHLENHWREGVEMFFFNSNCCGTVKFKRETIKMYPISTIAMKTKFWKKALANTTKLYTNADEMENYLYSTFGREAFESKDYREGLLLQLQPQWLFDQTLISYQIHQFLKKKSFLQFRESPKIGHEVMVKNRIDRAFWPERKQLKNLNISDHSDAHLSQQLLKDWVKMRPLFEKIFSPDNMLLTDLFIHQINQSNHQNETNEYYSSV